jgi:gluconate:H+ symporter, GntP family
MVQGPALLVILLAGIIIVIFMISKMKIHPFISLLLVSFGIAFAAGMPSGDIARTVTKGFGDLLGNIGIVIALGTIIGYILEKSGAALRMADSVVKLVGEKRPALAMSIIGYIVSIPVFCDSGFVILNSLRKSLSKKTGASSVALTVALATGLYATHTLVPPTPGPIAAAANLGLEHNLLMVILLGMLFALPAAAAGLFYALWIGRRIRSSEDSEEHQTADGAATDAGSLPGVVRSFSPIVVPILLLSLGSMAAFPGNPFGTGMVKSALVFLGVPVNALFAGFLCSLLLLPRFSEETMSGWIGEALKTSAIIILVTGAGGSLGAVLKATAVGEYLGSVLAAYNAGIFLPFIIAAAMKTAQGSSTVAMVTTSAMVAPILPSLGLSGDLASALAVMAVGAGAMTVSHANDSYFWVVSQFGGIQVNDAYRAQTVVTLVQGIVTILCIFIATLILL